MAQSSQFSAAKVLEAAQQAEASGNRDYAVQFYRHIAEQHPQSPEAVSAHDGLSRLLGPQLSSVSEQSDFTQPPNGRRPANPAGDSAAQNQAQAHSGVTAPPSAAVAAAAVQAQAGDPAHPVQGRNHEQPPANAAPASSSPHGARPGNTPVNGAAVNGKAAANGTSAGGTAVDTGIRAATDPSVLIADDASPFAGPAPTNGRGANPQNVQSQVISHQSGSAATSSQLQSQAYAKSQSNVKSQSHGKSQAHVKSKLHARPSQDSVQPGKDHYRIGRAVTYLFGFFGWLALIGGIVFLLAGTTAVFAPGLMPLNIFSTLLRGPNGLTSILTVSAFSILGGMVQIFLAQFARAVFDNANATRELVALQRTAARQQS